MDITQSDPKSPQNPSPRSSRMHSVSSISLLGSCNRLKFPPIFVTTRLGFTDLVDMFTVDVQRAERRRWLSAPFTIATLRLDRVENVAIRVELSNGYVSWGEAPILSFVTAQDQPVAMKKATEVCGVLRRSLAMTLGSEFASVGFWDQFGCLWL